MMAQPSSAKPNPIVIKKYANRRLYNTDTSSYVTLDDLCQMIKEGEDLVVYDAKNGDDITRSVLTQIIVEQESKGGQQLLPTNFLRQLISMYGNNMQSVVPRYLEYTMQTFTKNQSQMSDYFRSTFGGVFGQTFDQMSKQNMAIFENAMRMFAPFGTMSGMPTGSAAPASQQEAATRQAEEQAEAASAASQPQQASYAPHLRPVATPTPAAPSPMPAASSAAAPKADGSIEQMQNRLDELQKQIASLSKGDE